MPLAKPRDIIFIVGMHRSGTSALARVLSLCGAALPLRLMAPNSGNPTGYWEPHDAMELNERFLQARASCWSDPALTYRSAPRDFTGFSRYVALIRDYVHLIEGQLRQGFAAGGPVVLKEPRITALLPFWLAAAADAGYSAKAIHVFRKPADVASSLAARDGLSLEHAIALWQKYNLVGEHDARRVPRAFLSYEALMDDWERAIDRSSGQIGVALRVNAKARRAVGAFLSPNLHHHRSARIVPTGLPRAQRTAVRLTYDALQRATAGAAHTAAFDALLAAYSAGPAAATYSFEHDADISA